MQGYAIAEGGEGAAFADWGYLLVFKIVAQMLRPYKTNQNQIFPFSFLLVTKLFITFRNIRIGDEVGAEPRTGGIEHFI